jgi:predicted dehydrogenase
VSVQAKCKTALHSIEVEDTLVATLEFTNGALGVLEATTSVYPGYPRRLELSGSEGTLIIEGDSLFAADLRKSRADLIVGSAAGPDLRESSPVVSDIRGHQSVLADFLEAIRTNSTPRCDGREGRRSVSLVENIYEACRTGKEVRSKR